MKRIQGALRNRGLLYFYMPTSKIFLNYTDGFNVDEDMAAISYQGGYWDYRDQEGIARRCMDYTSADADSYVASSNMKNWSNIIRIGTMLTKTCLIYWIKVGIRAMQTWQVSYNDI